MKRKIKFFGTDKINLRLIDESDLVTTLSWRNRDDARIWFKHSSQITLEQHLAWFHQYRDKDDDFLFVIEAGGKLVGQASVYDIQWGEGTAEIGRFLVEPDSAGKGYIGHACNALIEFCRDTFSLRYLFLEVLKSNERAIGIYRKNGFLEEGLYENILRMGRPLSEQKVGDV